MSLLTQGPGNWLTAALQFLIDLQKQVPAERWLDYRFRPAPLHRNCASWVLATVPILRTYYTPRHACLNLHNDPIGSELTRER